MITRILYNEEREAYNRLIRHPVQTWEWGDFQISQGHQLYRLGVFEKNKMVAAYSLSFHHLPHLPYTIGTLLRGPKVNEEMIKNVRKIAVDENAIFVKFEPDVYQKVIHHNGLEENFSISMNYPNLFSSPKVAFYPFSYIVDLTKSEAETLNTMHPKTRYNIKVANRYGVNIHQASTDAGFETYLDLLFQTTKRQGFYLHTTDYHRSLWQTLKKTGMVHILMAEYQNKILAAYMLFHLQDRFFYPYGASLDIYRQVMAPTLLMWEAIKLGKSLGCQSFDMWGSLGPDAKEADPAFGFHRFKQGFGGDPVQFVGTYDLVINPNLYQLYNLVDKYRWQFLRYKAKFSGRT